jgi:hypothetical protein
VVSVHFPSQAILVVLVKPPPQSFWQALAKQRTPDAPPVVPLGVGQTLPQLPQLFLSLDTMEQYAALAPMAGQMVLPAAQLPAVHTPELQLWPLAQACPQAPQLAGSVARFTGAPPEVQVVVPLLVQTAATHTSTPAQTLPQPPQFSWLVVVSTQYGFNVPPSAPFTPQTTLVVLL